MGKVTDNVVMRLGLFRFKPSLFPFLCAADGVCVLGRFFPIVLEFGKKSRLKIFRRAKIKIRAGEVSYFCRATDICTINEVWKKEVYQRLSQFKPKHGDVVVDVGANIGEYAIFAAKSVGENGKVISFEPNSEASGLLRRNVVLNNFKNVKVISEAVNDKNGMVRIYRNPDNNTLDSMHQLSKEYYLSKSVTLDSALRNEKRIDILKIDTEGGEYLALKGAKKILRKKPRIVVELHDREIEEKVLAFLKSFGYSLKYKFFLIKGKVSIAYLEPVS